MRSLLPMKRRKQRQRRRPLLFCRFWWQRDQELEEVKEVKEGEGRWMVRGRRMSKELQAVLHNDWGANYT